MWGLTTFCDQTSDNATVSLSLDGSTQLACPRAAVDNLSFSYDDGEESVATARTPLGWTSTDNANDLSLGRSTLGERGHASAGRQSVCAPRARPLALGLIRASSSSDARLIIYIVMKINVNWAINSPNLATLSSSSLLSAAGRVRRSEQEGSLVGNHAAARRRRQRRRQHRNDGCVRRNVRVGYRWPQRRAP